MSRVYEKLQEVGLRSFALTTLQRIVPTDWLRAGRLVAPPFELEKGGNPRDVSDSVSRWASHIDLPLLGAFGHSRETLESRLGRGDRVFVLQRGAELLVARTALGSWPEIPSRALRAAAAGVDRA